MKGRYANNFLICLYPRTLELKGKETEKITKQQDLRINLLSKELQKIKNTNEKVGLNILNL